MLRRLTLALLLLPALACAASAKDTLDKIRETKTVTIAFRDDAQPFSFVDQSKQPTGYSIDLCRRVVASIGQQLGVDGLQIKWQSVTLQSRIDAVAEGQADMECGSTTATLGRMKQVNFSSFIFVDGTGLLVKGDAGLRQLSDLGGKKIGVLPGTTNEVALNAALARTVINAAVVPVTSREEGLAQLEEGKIDAFASDKVLLLGLGPKAKDPKTISMLQDNLSFEPYAIVLPRNDDNFRLAVNTALAQTYRSGAIREVFDRWFGGFGKPGLLLDVTYLVGSIPD
jgi:ABC-type amino acid transport substrate-binding protein